MGEIFCWILLLICASRVGWISFGSHKARTTTDSNSCFGRQEIVWGGHQKTLLLFNHKLTEIWSSGCYIGTVTVMYWELCWMPTFGMKYYECGPWWDSWVTIGLLSFPWRGRPGDKIILNSRKWHKPVLADIPYWISASFQVSPWLFLMWAFRLLILALLDPHTGQQNGFSPVCILMCIISFCFEMNFLLHWSHWCSQDSCLRKNA